MGEALCDRDIGSVQVDGGEIEVIDCFTYLGSNLSRDGDVMSDVNSRIEKASKAFGPLRGPILTTPTCQRLPKSRL